MEENGQETCGRERSNTTYSTQAQFSLTRFSFRMISCVVQSFSVHCTRFQRIGRTSSCTDLQVEPRLASVLSCPSAVSFFASSKIASRGTGTDEAYIVQDQSWNKCTEHWQRLIYLTYKRSCLRIHTWVVEVTVLAVKQAQT